MQCANAALFFFHFRYCTIIGSVSTFPHGNPIYICLANMLSDCIGEANMQTHVLEVLELLLTKLHRRAELTKSSSAFQRMRLSRRISDMQKASSSSSLLLLTPAHFLLLTSAPPSLLLKDSIASAQPRLLSKPPWHRRL